MQIATLVFYAVASFFLGVIATGSSAAIAVALGQPTNFAAPIVVVILAATFAAPVFFLALALVVAIRGDVLPGAPRHPGPGADADGESDDALDELLGTGDRYRRPRARP